MSGAVAYRHLVLFLPYFILSRSSAPSTPLLTYFYPRSTLKLTTTKALRQHFVSSLQCYQNAAFGQGVQATECGASFQFRQRHLQQQLCYALIGKAIGHHIDSRKIKYHLLLAVYQRQEFLTEFLPHGAGAKVCSVCYKLKFYHSESSSPVSTNVSLYSSATSVR